MILQAILNLDDSVNIKDNLPIYKDDELVGHMIGHFAANDKIIAVLDIDESKTKDLFKLRPTSVEWTKE